ncbi:unnamed protein product, partial [Prunus brigantina]
QNNNFPSEPTSDNQQATSNKQRNPRSHWAPWDLVVAGYNPIDFHTKAWGRGWRRVRTTSFRFRNLFPVGFSIFSNVLAYHDALLSYWQIWLSLLWIWIALVVHHFVEKSVAAPLVGVVWFLIFGVVCY